MSDLKNTLTDILAVILVIAGSVNAYLQSLEGDINWMQLVMVVVGAVVAYFTGKTAEGKKKSDTNLVKQKQLQDV